MRILYITIKLLLVFFTISSCRVHAGCKEELGSFLRYQDSTHLNVELISPVRYINPEHGSIEQKNPGLSKFLMRIILDLPSAEWRNISPIRDRDVQSFVQTYYQSISQIKNFKTDDPITSEVLNTLADDLEEMIHDFIQTKFNSFDLPSIKILKMLDLGLKLNSRINDTIIAAHFAGAKFYFGHSETKLKNMIYEKQRLPLKKGRKEPHDNSEIDIVIFKNDGSMVIVEGKSNRSQLLPLIIQRMIKQHELELNPTVSKLLDKEAEQADLDSIVQIKTLSQARSRGILRDQLKGLAKIRVYFVFRNAVDKSFHKKMLEHGADRVFYLQPDPRPFLPYHLDRTEKEN